MRWIALLTLLVTACYRPSLDHERCVRCGPNAECPGELACIEGLCGGPQSCTATADASALDANVVEDTGSDGTPPGRNCTLTEFTGQPIELGIAAPDSNPASFTVDAAQSFGVFKFSTRQIGTLAPGESTFTPILTDGTGMYLAPHVSPEGNEIFVQTKSATLPEYSFQVSYRSNETWSEPQPLIVRDGGTPVAIGGLDFPSTPSAFGQGPRLMVYLDDPSSFVELKENAPGSEIWEHVRAYTAASFGLDRLYHPQLSSDGRFLVFVGEKPTSTFSIYAAFRIDPTTPFSSAILAKLRDGLAHGLAHPFLTDDCRRLYYFDPTNGIMKLEQPPA